MEADASSNVELGGGPGAADPNYDMITTDDEATYPGFHRRRPARVMCQIRLLFALGVGLFFYALWRWSPKATVPHAEPTDTAAASLLSGDGYAFRFSLDVMFDSFDSGSPLNIFKSGSLAFHGNGPEAGTDEGRVVLYIHGGHVSTATKLAAGAWYQLAVGKTVDKLCIQVNIDVPNCAQRTVLADKFRISKMSDARFRLSPSVHVRNFRELPLPTLTTTVAVPQNHNADKSYSKGQLRGPEYRAMCEKLRQQRSQSLDLTKIC